MSASSAFGAGTMTAISSAFKYTLSQAVAVVCFIATSRAFKSAPVNQNAVGNCDKTGILCCARRILVRRRYVNAADSTMAPSIISRETSSGIKGEAPGVARTSLSL
jgi:hypothetical protein